MYIRGLLPRHWPRQYRLKLQEAVSQNMNLSHQAKKNLFSMLFMLINKFIIRTIHAKAYVGEIFTEQI